MKMPFMTRDDFRKQAAESTVTNDSRLRKEFVVEKAAVDRQSRTVTFKITTDEPDRDSDVIDSSGWDLTDYLKNPVVLWGHNYHNPPIARAIDVTRVDGGLRSTAQFPDEGVYPFADMVFELVAGDFIRASSVGFMPLEWSFDEERGGINFSRQALLEWSIVPVPANPDALVGASEAGIDLAPMRKWLSETIAAWPGDLKLAGKAWNKLQEQGAASKGNDSVTDEALTCNECGKAATHAAINAKYSVVDGQKVFQPDVEVMHGCADHQVASKHTEVTPAEPPSVASPSDMEKLLIRIDEMSKQIDEMRADTNGSGGDGDGFVFAYEDDEGEGDDGVERFSVDVDAVTESLKSVISQGMSELAREATRQSINQLRGRLD